MLGDRFHSPACLAFDKATSPVSVPFLSHLRFRFHGRQSGRLGHRKKPRQGADAAAALGVFDNRRMLQLVRFMGLSERPALRNGFLQAGLGALD